MALDSGSKYPNKRTYVLKLRRDAKADALSGRLENVVTGHQREAEGAARRIALLPSI